MSTFLLRSRLDNPQILLITDISKTRSFCLSSLFTVHVSELYRTVAYTMDLYNNTLVASLISSASHILFRLLTILEARPILRTTSALQLAS